MADSQPDLEPGQAAQDQGEDNPQSDSEETDIDQFMDDPNVSESDKMRKLLEAAKRRREQITQELRDEFAAHEKQLAELRKASKSKGKKKKRPHVSSDDSEDEVNKKLQELEDDCDESSEEEPTPKKKRQVKKTKKVEKPKKKDKKKKKKEESEEGELTDSSEDEEPFADLTGSFINEAKEWVQTATKAKTGPAVSSALKHYLVKAFMHTQEMENGQKLAEDYPMPENLSKILAPTLNIHVKKQKSITQRQKRQDYLMMRSQKLMLSGVFALCPLLDYVIKKGDSDKELDKIGDAVAKGVRLLFFANTQMVYNRRDIFYPQMDRKVAAEAVKATVGGKQLFDESVQEMVEEAKDGAKLCKDLLYKPPQKQQGFRPKGRGRGNPNYQNQPRPGNQQQPQQQAKNKAGWRSWFQRPQQTQQQYPQTAKKDDTYQSPLQQLDKFMDKPSFNKKK